MYSQILRKYINKDHARGLRWGFKVKLLLRKHELSTLSSSFLAN